MDGAPVQGDVGCMLNSRFILTTVLGAALWAPLTAAAQDAARPESIAFLFGYTPHAGSEALFDEGYRRHLAWHEARQDPLIWYGWNVLTGPRAGMFVDGTFGSPFVAVDNRVEPAADAADFAQTTAPHGSIVFRAAYVLRPELSTATPLEDGQPMPRQQVYRYAVRPGMAPVFETGVARLTAVIGDGVEWTCYEAIDGEALPGYLVVVHRDGFGDYATARGDFMTLARRHLANDDVLAETFVGSIALVESETWGYRADLSYLPE